MQYLLAFPAWDHRDPEPPAEAIVAARFYQAFRSPPALSGVRLGKDPARRALAKELSSAFKQIIRVSGNLAELRPEGGSVAISPAARAMLIQCWDGLVEHLPPGDIDDAELVEAYLQQMETVP